MQKYIRDEKMHRVWEIQYSQERQQKISCTDLTLTDALSKNKNEKEKRERKGKKDKAETLPEDEKVAELVPRESNCKPSAHVELGPH